MLIYQMYDEISKQANNMQSRTVEPFFFDRLLSKHFRNIIGFGYGQNNKNDIELT